MDRRWALLSPPDGRRIAHSTWDERAEHSALYSVRPDGKDKKLLAERDDAAIWPLVWAK